VRGLHKAGKRLWKLSLNEFRNRTVRGRRCHTVPKPTASVNTDELNIFEQTCPAIARICWRPLEHVNAIHCTWSAVVLPRPPTVTNSSKHFRPNKTASSTPATTNSVERQRNDIPSVFSFLCLPNSPQYRNIDIPIPTLPPSPLSCSPHHLL
jgi:hypothetical protein